LEAPQFMRKTIIRAFQSRIHFNPTSFYTHLQF
jgi:hypothetical protein